MVAKMFYKLTLVIALSIASLSANANIIIDTGSPALTQNGAISVCGKCGGPTTSSGQSVALQFSVSDYYDITSIQGFLWQQATGTLTLALYDNVNETPGSQIYSSSFQATDIASAQSGWRGSWAGVSGINWTVSPGKYWAAFEVRNGQTYEGALEFPAPIPLPAAVNNSAWGQWTNIGSGGGGGLLVSGNLVPVPEINTNIMLLIGLGLFGFIARRQNNQRV